MSSLGLEVPARKIALASCEASATIEESAATAAAIAANVPPVALASEQTGEMTRDMQAQVEAMRQQKSATARTGSVAAGADA